MADGDEQDADRIQVSSATDFAMLDSKGRPGILRIVLVKVNVARPICDHVIGEEHTPEHRMVAGVVVMFVGVGVAHTAAYMPLEALKWIADALGYGIHALGTLPFLEHLTESYRNSDKQ
jgi:hypothetical protein